MCVPLHNCHSLVPRVHKPTYQEQSGQREVDASDDDEDDVEMIDPEPQQAAEFHYKDIVEEGTNDAAEQASAASDHPESSSECVVEAAECEDEEVIEEGTGDATEQTNAASNHPESSSESLVEAAECEYEEIVEEGTGDATEQASEASDHPQSPSEGFIESRGGFETGMSSVRVVDDDIGEGSSENVAGQLEVITGECQEVAVETEKDLSEDDSSDEMEVVDASPDTQTPTNGEEMVPRVEQAPENFEVVTSEVQPTMQMDILAEAFQEGAQPGDIVEYLIATCEEVIQNGPYEEEGERLVEGVVDVESSPFVPPQMAGNQLCTNNGQGMANDHHVSQEEHTEDMDILVNQLMVVSDK